MKPFSKTKNTFFKSLPGIKFSILCCAFLLSLINNAAAQKAGVFYAVTGNGLKDTSYLFGTYHLIKSSYLDDKQAVQYAFKKSKGVVVETVIDSSQLAAANAKSLLQGRQLTDLLDKSTADSLDTALKQNLGAGISQFNALKPMTVMVTISLVQQMKDNAALMDQYTGSPLDISFVDKGKAGGKTITPLETMLEQMDFLFNRIGDEQQADYLKLFIRNQAENRKLGNELVQAYFGNDLAAMYLLYEKASAISGDMEFLVKGRNNNWMKILPSLMKKQSQFIATGALHLAGSDGLVAQLKRMGYTVTPLNL